MERTLLCALGLALSLGACGKSDRAPASGSADDEAAAAEPAKKKDGEGAALPAKLEAAIGAVFVSDLTPADKRPIDLSVRADSVVRKALIGEGRFRSVSQDDPKACKADVQVYYALMVNGEPVVAAEAGLARVGMDARLYCPPAEEGGDFKTFAVEFDDEASFGGSEGKEGPAQLKMLLARLAPRVAAGLYGQLEMYGADDAAVEKALAESKDLGVLMEAAAEAGERKLEGATPHLVRLLGHQEEMVVLRAGAALGLIGKRDSDVVRALAKLTRGPVIERHLVAVNALGDIGGDEAARYLDAIAVGDPDPRIRELARMAAKRARGQDPEADPSEGGDPAEIK